MGYYKMLKSEKHSLVFKAHIIFKLQKIPSTYVMLQSINQHTTCSYRHAHLSNMSNRTRFPTSGIFYSERFEVCNPPRSGAGLMHRPHSCEAHKKKTKWQLFPIDLIHLITDQPQLTFCVKAQNRLKSIDSTIRNDQDYISRKHAMQFGKVSKNCTFVGSFSTCRLTWPCNQWTLQRPLWGHSRLPMAPICSVPNWSDSSEGKVTPTE